MRFVLSFLLCIILISGVQASALSPFFSPTPLSNKDISVQRQNNSPSADNFIDAVNQHWTGIVHYLSWGYEPKLRNTVYKPTVITITGQNSDLSIAVFSSFKDISMLDACTKHNYLLAFEQLDGKVINPWESFNFNAFLTNLRGYCTGRGAKTFSFYGGVCGVASQLFRAWLSSPQVRIDKRRGHNDRYMQYYGSEVEGDDAAVYERSKQFVFTNTSDFPFLIKTEESRNHTKLFFITEAKAVDQHRVTIDKKKITPLTIDLSKKVFKQAQISKISCKNQISPFFVPQKLDCQTHYQAQELSSQSFRSRYLKLQDRSL